jgi:hypothetical protein
VRRERSSYRMVLRLEQVKDDFWDDDAHEYVYTPKEWHRSFPGENRPRAVRGRHYRQRAPYKEDPVLWVVMDGLKTLAASGLVLGLVGAVIRAIRTEVRL